LTPLLLGHRGASADLPENSIRAFERAMQDGADGVELDVMRCKSGEVVVFHDDDLQRLCGVAGATRAQPWAALRELRVRGEPIPQLDDVLEALPGRAVINVELKTAPGWAARITDDGLPASVAHILRRHGLGSRALVSSFDPMLLWRFRRLAPEISTGLLFAADQSLPLRRGWSQPLVGALAVHPEAALVDERRVRDWRRRGLGINVWTVDAPGEIRYLASLGVDAIITNRPRQAREALGLSLVRQSA
jgi:glycerophosphoryl diester phosphodiesterase